MILMANQMKERENEGNVSGNVIWPSIYYENISYYSMKEMKRNGVFS